MYYDAKKHFAAHGIITEGVSIDLPAMMSQKLKAVEGLTKGIEGLFKKNKVTYMKGWGSFASNTEVKVSLLDGGETSVKAKNIMIATGSDATSVPGLTIDEQRCSVRLHAHVCSLACPYLSMRTCCRSLGVSNASRPRVPPLALLCAAHVC
jgi:pyruvate/2-oxoglutarate dehydrogenase complex dihydrolipoamide dehydrogenase (E3) component